MSDPTLRRWILAARTLGVVVLLLLAVTAPATAQVATWQVGVVPSVLTGTYGTEARTDVWYTPFIVRRLFVDGDLTLVLPHACIRGDETVTVVGGTPVPTTTGPPVDRGAPGAARGQVGAGTAVADATTTTTFSQCGLGDIVLRGRYYLADERGWRPTVAVRAHVKVPTADEARGLGTGRADEGIGIEVSRSLAPGVLFMVDGGYTRIGRPPDRRYRDSWWYDVGLSRTIVPGRADLSVFFEQYRSIVPGRADARDLLGVLTLRGTSGWRVQLSAQVGLTDTAPDFGLTLGATSRF